ncbi:uncharacterized protein LAJ45_04505 [Morchella importuna]|uniref:uncharacterized protein n=1 Tax=Morchella importuna TaxID=1174673 RepID=UPI001E8CB201|nr:uncharacterized protein LAJ45_04505 [Morchella importuna]KAH8151303.1 hypothetical protein LAJ45_04505 [Morchella importuna]
MAANQRATNAAELYPLVMADVIDAARTTFEDAGISVSLLAELESLWKQNLTEAGIGELFPWESQPPSTSSSPEPEPEPVQKRLGGPRRILRPPSPTPPVSTEIPPHPMLSVPTTAAKPELPPSFTSHILSTHTKSEIAHMEHMMRRSRQLADSNDPNEMDRMMASIRSQERLRLLRDAGEREDIERRERAEAARNYEARLRADRYLESRMPPTLKANAIDIARAAAAVSAASSICSRDSAAINRAESQSRTAAAIAARNNEARAIIRNHETRFAAATDSRGTYERRVIPPAMAAPIPPPTTGMEFTGFAETYRQRVASAQMQRKQIPPQLPLQGTTLIGGNNTRPAQAEQSQAQGASSMPVGISDDQWAFLNTIQKPMPPVQQLTDSASQQTGGIRLTAKGELYWDSTLPFQSYSSDASPTDSYIWNPATEVPREVLAGAPTEAPTEIPTETPTEIPTETPMAIPEVTDSNQPAPEWDINPELQALVDQVFPPHLAGEVFPPYLSQDFPQLDGNDDNDETELDENDDESRLDEDDEAIGPYGERDEDDESNDEEDDDDEEDGENSVVCLYEVVKKSKVKRGGTIWKFLLRNGVYMAADGQEYPFSRGSTELVW